MTFGKRLKNARLCKGITQRELGRIINASHNSISNWENDQNKPDMDTIELICGTLDITPNYLINGNDDGNNDVVPADVNNVIRMYLKLDEISKATVDNVLNFEYKQSLARNRAENKNLFRNLTRLYSVTYYPEPVSAGTGQYLDYTSLQTLTINTTPPIGADFILRVIGDSMEPEYPDGGLVFVRIQKTIEIGEVGIFFSEGNVYMKVLGENGLESLNKKYPTIEGDKDIKCIGKVVGKLSWSNVVE